ncbi:hypothetical protein BGZ79_000231 [Entomortierella chlamydospora]|nr:hypothetical protein BGZ79_000231 [Entomortierella chlamydospora]
MYPNQAGRVIDKENDVVDSARGSTPHATLVKQTSLLGSRTPSSKQQQLPLKPNLAKTPSQQGKISNLSVNSPGAQGVLRAKTNQQQLPPAVDNNTTTLKKKSNLTRTFSAALDNNSNNNNNNSNSNNDGSSNNISNTDSTLSTPTNTESRRRSLTKRGSAKSRLVVHKDEPISKETAETSSKRTKDTKPSAVLVKSAPIESATTLLSIERAVESQEKMVVGPAETKTKRRALTNDDHALNIEYCPPPVEEQPYDPGFELDGFALSTVPPNIAYHFSRVESLHELDTELPIIEASTNRSSSPITFEQEEDNAPMPKPEITADGHYNVVWSDDEDDDKLHPDSGRQFGIKDLQDESKTRPPFDGFVFELDPSEDSLSEDEDDILGGDLQRKTERKKTTTGKEVSDFNETFGLGDLEDESKVQAPFSDFAFEL